jgi:hypothetical protein
MLWCVCMEDGLASYVYIGGDEAGHGSVHSTDHLPGRSSFNVHHNYGFVGVEDI